MPTKGIHPKIAAGTIGGAVVLGTLGVLANHHIAPPWWLSDLITIAGFFIPGFAASNPQS